MSLIASIVSSWSDHLSRYLCAVSFSAIFSYSFFAFDESTVLLSSHYVFDKPVFFAILGLRPLSLYFYLSADIIKLFIRVKNFHPAYPKIFFSMPLGIILYAGGFSASVWFETVITTSLRALEVSSKKSRKKRRVNSGLSNL